MVKRRILLSAFACSPLWGSEPGVGWQWLLHVARRHEVVLLTHAYFRAHIEPALAAAGLSGIEVHYLQAPAGRLHPHRQLNSRAYYVWWQWHARAVARRLVAERPFDAIHHLTWGTLRLPVFLGGLGVPLVMGPLGGGEVAPLRLFSGLPIRELLFDVLRSATLGLVRVDPFATWAPRRSALVLCRSKSSLNALPFAVRERAMVAPEIGSPAVDVSLRSSRREVGPRRLLFAGRLIGWKGVAIALGAVEQLVAAGHDVTLDIAGDGPLRGHLAARIEATGLGSRVRLLGMVPRAELLTLYARADLFIFPSLHDASGTVVLEALSRGLPVVCLDLGGPQQYVDSKCGVVVPTLARSREDVERAVANAVAAVLVEPGRLERMSRAAAEHAARQTWAAAVERSYALIASRLGWSEAGIAAQSGSATSLAAH